MPTSSAFSSVICNPDWPNACLDAAIAKCSKASVRRISLRSMKTEGSKFLTSAPKWTLNRLVSKNVIGPTPDFPWHRASHVDETLLPTGVRSPIPVITTRDTISPPRSNYIANELLTYILWRHVIHLTRLYYIIWFAHIDKGLFWKLGNIADMEHCFSR